jgi:hypothetical protein
MLINVAIPGYRNAIKKEAGKILKYKDLTTEIQRMWNVKTQVLLVIRNRGDWVHLKVTQTISGQRTGKARNKETVKNQP